MHQPDIITDADFAEIRLVTDAAVCTHLLTDGWELVGIYPLTTVAEMGAGQPGDGQQDKRIEDTQRYVRRLVGYVVGRRQRIESES
jgi:hypothetical protein